MFGVIVRDRELFVAAGIGAHSFCGSRIPVRYGYGLFLSFSSPEGLGTHLPGI